MPKDEFDFEDPFELNGMALLSHEDTTEEMAECFAEEFMRMGYNHKQILGLFRNPQYLGPNMAWEKRGESFIRDLIAEVFARRGKAVSWEQLGSSRREEAQTSSARESQSLVTSAATTDEVGTLTDPMGVPIPKLSI